MLHLCNCCNIFVLIAEVPAKYYVTGNLVAAVINTLINVPLAFRVEVKRYC